MKFEHTEVWGFEHALCGMRNPMNSWDKSEWSGIDDPSKPNFTAWVKTLPYAKEFIIGDNENE